MSSRVLDILVVVAVIAGVWLGLTLFGMLSA